MSLLFTLLFGITFANKPQYQAYDYMIREYPPSNSSDSLGICYGSRTTWNQDPYAVALRYVSGSACCSGSIVSLSPPILLTAAHCSGCNGLVRIGCNNPSNCDGDFYSIAQVTENSGFDTPNWLSNDLAVVRLNSVITTPNAQSVIIPTTEEADGSELHVVGYGITQRGSIPRSLQEGDTNIFSRTDCGALMTSLLGGGTFIDTSMICVLDGGGRRATTTCSGDSGGPSGIIDSGTGRLIQYGVTSWGLVGSGPGCNGCYCCNGFPAVYANVALHADWINSYIREWTKGNFNYTAHGDKHYFHSN